MDRLVTLRKELGLEPKVGESQDIDVEGGRPSGGPGIGNTMMETTLRVRQGLIFLAKSAHINASIVFLL